MKITISEECIACEQCVEICPEVFTMGDEFAEVTVEEVPDEYKDSCRQAAEECPSEAIIIDE